MMDAWWIAVLLIRQNTDLACYEPLQSSNEYPSPSERADKGPGGPIPKADSPLSGSRRERGKKNICQCPKVLPLPRWLQ